jgi:hypothetical protein
MLKEERGMLLIISMTGKMDDVVSLLAQSKVGELAMDSARRIPGRSWQILLFR